MALHGANPDMFGTYEILVSRHHRSRNWRSPQAGYEKGYANVKASAISAKILDISTHKASSVKLICRYSYGESQNPTRHRKDIHDCTVRKILLKSRLLYRWHILFS